MDNAGVSIDLVFAGAVYGLSALNLMLAAWHRKLAQKASRQARALCEISGENSKNAAELARRVQRALTFVDLGDIASATRVMRDGVPETAGGKVPS